jgi:hypothetical protein
MKDSSSFPMQPTTGSHDTLSLQSISRSIKIITEARTEVFLLIEGDCPLRVVHCLLSSPSRSSFVQATDTLRVRPQHVDSAEASAGHEGGGREQDEHRTD